MITAFSSSSRVFAMLSTPSAPTASMLAVTISPHGFILSLSGEGYIVPRASHHGITPVAGRGRRPVTAHRVGSSLRSSNSQKSDLVSQAVIHVAAGAMLDVGSQRLADGARVGIVPVRRDLRGRMADHGGCPLEEPLGGVHVARLAQQGVDQVPVGVDGPIQVAPAPVHRHKPCHLRPALPRRLARRRSVSSGAKRFSHARTASWVKVKPRVRNISARSRRLSL